MSRSINVLSSCQLLGYTRQAYYKVPRGILNKDANVVEPILQTIIKARKANPTKGCRAVYEQQGQRWPIGRDKSIALMMDFGYRVKYPKSYKKATQAGNREFANLLVNKEVTGINQVWQADMAYYLYGDERFYTMYITDVYSQEVVGYGAFRYNFAANYSQVLSKAIRKQKKHTINLHLLIHHSDGGKQYESSDYKNLCKRHGIKQSMCLYSYENPYAEKTNDLINNGYLNKWKPKSLIALRQMQELAVKDHNVNSWKRILGKRSPLEFKNQLLNNPNGDMIYHLMLKPVNPAQPKNKLLQLNNNVISLNNN